MGEAANVVEFNEREEGDPRDGDTRETLYNLEAERGLLGAIFVDNGVMEDVIETGIKPEMFALTANARVFDGIQRVIARGRIADPVSLRPYMEADSDNARVFEELEGVGRYLAHLAASAINVVNAPHYAEIIVDFHRKRQVRKLLQDALVRVNAADIDDSADSIVEDLERDAGNIHDGGSVNQAPDPAKGIDRTVAQIEEAYKAGGRILGVKTGYPRLDKMMSGLRKSKLHVLAGRPAMGKTALATCIAENAAEDAKETGGVVAFYSHEMDEIELNERRISMRTGIPYERIRDGYLQPDEWPSVAKAAAELKALPVVIDDTTRLTVRQMQTMARRLQRNHGLALVIIDYLQLIEAEKTYGGNRVAEVSEITRALKIMARELDVPVLALSQLSRAIEGRDDKRPKLSDLRESGSIEQDADVVMFVYREIEYLRKEEPVETAKLKGEELQQKIFEWSMRCERVKNDAEIIVDKVRGGRTGSVRLQFIPEHTQFKNPNVTGDMDV